MTDFMPDLVSVEVLRRLQAGDVVLVTLRSDVDDEEVEMVHGVLSELVVEDVHLIVTREGYVKRFHKMQLAELMSLQAAVEAAIESVTAHRAVDSEV